MPNPFNPMSNIYQSMMNASNPMQLFSQLAMQNPRLQPILNALNGGANPQQLFYSMCQQRGVDPQAFLKSITNRR